MAKEDDVFLLFGAYPRADDAKADYEVVKALHAEKAVGAFDAAVISKDEGKVDVNTLGGHLWKGLSRSDLKDIGQLLDDGHAALVVIGDWRLAERIDELLRHAERREARQLRDHDRAETERQISSLILSRGEG